MKNPITALLRAVFPKYKICKIQDAYGIEERFGGVFYRRMRYTKVIDNKHWIRQYTRFNKLLTFDTEEDVESEIDRLYFGYAPIDQRLYVDGQIATISFTDGSVHYLKEDIYD